MKKFLTRTIVLLGVISLLTDVASEMLYPIMPAYLQSIGYGVMAIGVIEGVAEIFAGIAKVFFAHKSDVSGKRKNFISIGYGISALAKPLIGFTSSIGAIFTAKLVDRVGKGVRTAPRDALLTEQSTMENRGKVFGFHRGLDTLGAILGPAIGLTILYFSGGNFRPVFLLAFIPGIAATILTFFLRENKKQTIAQDNKIEVVSSENIKITEVNGVVDDSQITTEAQNNINKEKSLKAILSFWKKTSPSYRRIFIGFVLFSLINSTNMFLLLRLSELHFSPYLIIAAYLVYNVSFALLSYPIGLLADKIGFKPVYVFGIISFAIVYAVLGYGTSSMFVAILIFILYGVFGAVEDGMAKAWLSRHIDKQYKATGIGFYLLFNSLCLFVASIGTAFLWKTIGSGITLTLIATLSLGVLGYMMFIPERK